MPANTLPVDAVARLTRPIVGIENRTAREVFDIMVDRIDCGLPVLATQIAGGGEAHRELTDRERSVLDEVANWTDDEWAVFAELQSGTLRRFSDFIAKAAQPALDAGAVRPLDLAILLHHALDSGAAGVKWIDYDCTNLGQYHRVAEACGIPAEYYSGYGDITELATTPEAPPAPAPSQPAISFDVQNAGFHDGVEWMRARSIEHGCQNEALRLAERLCEILPEGSLISMVNGRMVSLAPHYAPLGEPKIYGDGVHNDAPGLNALAAGEPVLQGDKPAPAGDADDLVGQCHKTLIYGTLTIEEFLDISADDAVQLGINITSRDESGNPKFHGISDIRQDEYAEAEKELLRRVLAPALATITRLTAERDALEKRVEKLEHHIAVRNVNLANDARQVRAAIARATAAEAELAASRAEVERKDAALQEVVEGAYAETVNDAIDTLRTVRDIALAALSTNAYTAHGYSDAMDAVQALKDIAKDALK